MHVEAVFHFCVIRISAIFDQHVLFPPDVSSNVVRGDLLPLGIILIPKVDPVDGFTTFHFVVRPRLVDLVLPNDICLRPGRTTVDENALLTFDHRVAAQARWILDPDTVDAAATAGAVGTVRKRTHLFSKCFEEGLRRWVNVQTSLAGHAGCHRRVNPIVQRQLFGLVIISLARCALLAQLSGRRLYKRIQFPGLVLALRALITIGAIVEEVVVKVPSVGDFTALPQIVVQVVNPHVAVENFTILSAKHSQKSILFEIGHGTHLHSFWVVLRIWIDLLPICILYIERPKVI